MPRDTAIFNYRKDLPPLRQAFEHVRYHVAKNAGAPAHDLPARTQTCVLDLYAVIRNPWATLGLMRPPYCEYSVSFLGNMDDERYKEHAE